MPAVQGLPPPEPGELVPIADLEPWAQAAFPGYKSLNRIQSRIFQTAYYRQACCCCVWEHPPPTNTSAVLMRLGDGCSHTAPAAACVTIVVRLRLVCLRTAALLFQGLVQEGASTTCVCGNFA